MKLVNNYSFMVLFPTCRQRFNHHCCCDILINRKVDTLWAKSTFYRRTITCFGVESLYLFRKFESHYVYTWIQKFFVDQIRNHRKTTPEVLKAAGYDPSWFAQGCKSSLRRRILEEADSEQGLRPPRGLSTEQQLAAFEAKDLSTQKQMPVSKNYRNGLFI